MHRIAVIINGDLSINRQGQLNSAINRIKHIMQFNIYDIDVFCVQEYDCGLLRLLHHKKTIKRKEFQLVDGILVNIVYKRNFIIDYIKESLIRVLHIYSSSSYRFRRVAKGLKEYELVVGHSFIGGLVAYEVNSRFGTPYCAVWHGSDIHTNPRLSKDRKVKTASIIEKASGNIFVSKSLYNSAKEFFGDIPHPLVAHNAPGPEFRRYNDEKRVALRVKEKVYDKRVVAFVGNLVPVKNLFTLPGIFKKIEAENNNVAFWIVGDGMLRNPLEKKMEEGGIACRFWGNMQPECIPDIMNCIDVLILPSKNESFGMVLVEAISCGANVVGSNSGGIPEVIGNENSFKLDDCFEDNIANRTLYMLKSQVKQSVNPLFDWQKTAELESKLFLEILDNKYC